LVVHEIRLATMMQFFSRPSGTLGATANRLTSGGFYSSIVSSLSRSFWQNQEHLITKRFRSNRSRRGLYDGKDIRSGKNVSFSMKKTNRKFKPNVFKKRLYSETLDEMIRFHVTTSALRSIDKAGGLDNYLLNSKHVTGGEGMAAKERILERMQELKDEAELDGIDQDSGIKSTE